MPVNPAPADPRTRKEILAAAGRLFSERGFANVSIRDICDASRVTPPTIYYYFGNKNKLFQEVIRSSLSLQDFQMTLIAAEEAQFDPAGRLCAFVHHYLSHFPREFFNPGMFLESSTQLSPISFEQVRSEFQTLNDLAQQILRAGIRSGDFKDVNVVAATEYLMNLLMAYVLGEVHYGQSHDPDATTNFICDLFLNGIKDP
jgi:AcrR family transcriptional regulator